MNIRKKVNQKNKKLTPTKQLLLAIGIFVVAVMLTRDANMPAWEISIFRFIYDWPKELLPFFRISTYLGSIYVLGALAVMYFVVRRYHILLRLLLTGTLAYLLTGFAKDIWGRPRPSETLTDIISLDSFRGAGFPSGHMALAVAMALTMWHYLPRKYRWVAVLWIVVVGISRVYLGVHAPLDIAGGYAIGWGSYALFRHVRLQDNGIVKKHSKDN